MLDMTKKRPKPPEPMALVNVPRNVHFGLDKSNINEKAVVILDRVTEILQAYPNMTIKLIGHTDSRASKAYNQALSERRAQSVLKYLVAKGIATTRIDLRGEGFNSLKTDADELMGHALSRRVEMDYVGETIQSYDQTGDLMLEEETQARPSKKPLKSKKILKKAKK
jgi:outer membrane protein OmpA-like peptidoglycan-associated protein